ncbi:MULTISPECIES: MFS transporter [unclassified Bacillus (in: firmicutes)]|uniref:MFS transporter n=1 Tax=unclassified Bacillus (in: firmicutes) TaxID=185979 RepID=UPI0008F1DB30|nr:MULTISPECIES: MFS transporter [unclassified Bacillus (in: firmicutes)]SFA76846.1 Predicted arabinose efflux permease, MFS family [Bacillus sp. UNCCL13]SFQ66716.1 Predicted arabinose efflux permease, MFS family [Bacillus sp. cl95]
MKLSMFRPLRIKGYRSLFGAQLFSDLGNWLDMIALQVIVAFHWGLGETAVATLIIVLGIPWVVIGPFASVFIDKLPKKTVMLTCLVLRITCVIGLFFASNFLVLLVFVFIKSTVAALYDPARQSVIRMTVPKELLPEAVTLSQLSMNTMKIIGPALGAALIAIIGVRSPFIFEAIGFAISILFLLTLPSLKPPVSDDESEQNNTQEQVKTSYWKDLSIGIRHIFSVPPLKISILISSIAFFIIFLYDGLFIFVAKDLGFSHNNYGYLVSAVGLGSVIGALFLGNWTNWQAKPISFMAISSVLSGTLIISVGLGAMGILNLEQWVWFFGALLLGIMGSGEAVPYGYILQSETPEIMMARVSSAANSIQTFSMLIAPAAGALLADLIGVSFVMVGAGAATVLFGTSVLISFARRMPSGRSKSNSAQI